MRKPELPRLDPVPSDEAAAVWLDPHELKPLLNNPRKNLERAVGVVTRLIERFGWGPTVVVQRSTGRVVAGNVRVAAALELGLDKVPARVLDLSDQDARAMALADNRAGEVAQWEKTLLADDLAALQEQGQNLFELGFEKGEVDKLLGHERALRVPDPDVREARASFYLTATGDLPDQIEVLDKLREYFADTDVEVAITVNEW